MFSGISSCGSSLIVTCEVGLVPDLNLFFSFPPDAFPYFFDFLLFKLLQSSVLCETFDPWRVQKKDFGNVSRLTSVVEVV